MARHAEFMVTGMQGGLKFLPGRTKTGWIRNAGQTYPKLFHLFFLQARGVKIEAWLKDKFEGWGGRGRRRQHYAEVMLPQTNKQTGNDWRWGTPNRGHLPVSKWSLRVMTLCMMHSLHCVVFFFFLKKTLEKWCLGFVVRRECLQGAVMHRSSDRPW